MPQRLGHVDFTLEQVWVQYGDQHDSLFSVVLKEETAKERAWCDGPPHCCQVALDETERFVEE